MLIQAAYNIVDSMYVSRINEQALTAVSLTQDGCVAYDVFESATRPGILLICETWRDQAALDAHSASEPFKKYVGVMNDAGEMKIESFSF